MRREYKHGSKYALWRWKDIYWQGELYLRRLILVQCPLFSIMLHWIKNPDKQQHLHDHPVSFLSIVLSGMYLQATSYEYLGNRLMQPCDYRLVKWFRFYRAEDKHKISMVKQPNTITLCIAGPRRREWGYYTEDGWMHWKEYHAKYDVSTS